MLRTVPAFDPSHIAPPVRRDDRVSQRLYLASSAASSGAARCGVRFAMANRDGHQALQLRTLQLLHRQGSWRSERLRLG
jgi:hypothetical protein